MKMYKVDTGRKAWKAFEKRWHQGLLDCHTEKELEGIWVDVETRDISFAVGSEDCVDLTEWEYDTVNYIDYDRGHLEPIEANVWVNMEGEKFISEDEMARIVKTKL